ncbi:hypothetical protein Gotur_001855 [Gossypium turneri]
MFLHSTTSESSLFRSFDKHLGIHSWTSPRNLQPLLPCGL